MVQDSIQAKLKKLIKIIPSYMPVESITFSIGACTIFDTKIFRYTALILCSNLIM